MKTLCLALALLTAAACNSGPISVGPSGIAAPPKWIAEQNGMYFQRMQDGSIILAAYGDTGTAATAITGILAGAYTGAKFGGAPGAIAGGVGGGLLGQAMDDRATTHATAVDEALRALGGGK